MISLLVAECLEVIALCISSSEKQCFVQNCEMSISQMTSHSFDDVLFENVKINLSGEYEIHARNCQLQDVTVTYGYLTIQAGHSLQISNFTTYTTRQLTFLSEVMKLSQLNVVSNTIALFASSDLEMWGTNTLVSLNKACKGDCQCKQPCAPHNYTSFQSIMKYSDPTHSTLNLSDFMEAHSYATPRQLLQGMLASNFTLVIVAQKSLDVKNGTQFMAANLGIYAYSLSLAALAYVQSQGCASKHGYGCGYQDAIATKLQCGYSGASHASPGGAPISEDRTQNIICQQLLPYGIYGNPFNPILEGSGGGQGIGGGVIYIESLHSLSLDGRIQANGQRIDLAQRSAYLNSYGGFGSGGSIQVHTRKLKGNGLIQANGAGSYSDSEKGYGGFGGAGRILINITDWYIPGNDDQNSVRIESVSGLPYKGSLIEGRQLGSIVQSPCLPGYEFTQNSGCQPCQLGYYKQLVNQRSCLPCQNTRYLFKDTIQTSPFCEYDGCVEGYSLKHGECITNIEKITSLIGGENGLFAIIILMSLLIFSSLILIIRKRQRQTKKFKFSMIEDFDPSSLIIKREESSARPDFILEDLPYHVRRFYLHGENQIYKPWFINQNTEIDIDLQKLENFVKLFNEAAKFSQFQIIVLSIFKYLYFPIYYFCNYLIKKRKFAQLSQLVSKIKTSTFETNETGLFIKFSTTPDFTLGFIDLLNYKKDLLAWSNQTEFPITLVLSGTGTFLHPLNISISDPLIRSLKLSFTTQEEDDYSKNATFETFIENFNQYSQMIDFRQTQKQFIHKFIKLLELVEYYEIFQENEICVDLCIHILAQQSTIIMLSNNKNKDLVQILKDVHYLKNFHSENEIKFTINFDRMEGEKKYDNQIVVATDMDLNEQIEEYKQYEDDQEEMYNLKQQMMRKMESEEIQRPLIETKNVNSITEEVNISCKQRLIKYFFQFCRIVSIHYTFYARIRKSKMSQKTLPFFLVLVMLIQFMLNILYILVLMLQLNENLHYTITVIEFTFQILVFPLSWFFSPILLMFWLINNRLGKIFLLTNYVAILNTAIIFVIGLVQLAASFTIEEHFYQLHHLVRIGIFLNLNAMSYLGSQFLTDQHYHQI